MTDRDDPPDVGFTMLPNALLKRDEFGVGPRAVYDLLRLYARQDGECFPGEERLAKHLGAGVRTVRIYLAQLVQMGLIEVVRYGKGRANVYRVLATGPPTAPLQRQNLPPSGRPHRQNLPPNGRSPAGFATTPAGFVPNAEKNDRGQRQKTSSDEDARTKTHDQEAGRIPPMRDLPNTDSGSANGGGSRKRDQIVAYMKATGRMPT